MQLIRGLSGRGLPGGGCVVTIGSYDGIHLGHRALLARLAEHAVRRAEPPVLLTFEPLPREYLVPDDPPARLTSLRERFSSSGVRAALADSDFERARRWLGRPWSMRGRVVAGERRGRKLGFPTANLPLERRRAPVAGIFAVRVRGVAGEALPGVASLGTRPTVGGVEPLLEAHVFDFSGDLYGRELEVEFAAKLRDEACFASLAALTAQMRRDADDARRILAA